VRRAPPEGARRDLSLGRERDPRRERRRRRRRRRRWEAMETAAEVYRD